jgi:hypothetical protein
LKGHSPSVSSSNLPRRKRAPEILVLVGQRGSEFGAANSAN